MPLELTTTIRRVSSSPKARSGLSPAAAAGRAVASIRYITRSTAAEAVEWSGARLDAVAPEGHRAVKAALAEAIQERAQEGGKQGRVIAGRFIVSLPNDWPLDARREALRRVCAHLAPPGSDALAMGALHNDKPDNPHMHILAVDGLEAPELARARADARKAKQEAMPPGSPPKAVLARRRDALRLNDLKRPKELRRDIAAILNDIAQRDGLEGVEWRSFAERGIDRPATKHDGPEKRARLRKQAENAPPIDYTPPPRKPLIRLPERFAQPKETPPMVEAAPAQPAPVPKPSLDFTPGERPPPMSAIVPTVRDPEARAIQVAAAKARLAPPAPSKPKPIFKNGRWITPSAKRPSDEER